jgi:hypothetical protein
VVGLEELIILISGEVQAVLRNVLLVSGKVVVGHSLRKTGRERMNETFSPSGRGINEKKESPWQ